MPKFAPSARGGHRVLLRDLPAGEPCQNLEKAAADNPRTGQPTDSDASMLLRRLKIYRFTVRLEAPAGQEAVPHCARCFAQLVLNQARD